MRKNPYTNEMSSIKYCLFLYFLSLLSYNAGAQNEWLQLVSEKRLSEHAFILAADSMAGRGIDPGYRGLDMAAEYLQNQIKEIGLQPVNGSYLQPFELNSSVPNTAESYIKTTDSKGQVKHKLTDFAAMEQVSEILDFSGTLFFAGFGYTNKENNYNDFHDSDIKDKVIIFSTGTPETYSTGSSGQLNNQLERTKIKGAMDAGAKGVILVTSPHDKENRTYNQLKRISSRKRYSLHLLPETGNQNLAVITPEAANALLNKKNTWEKMLSSISAHNKPASFEVKDTRIEVSSRRINSVIQTANIMGFIEGNDPALKDECVLFMAHYDHLGMDEKGEIYNGADDNASGIAVLLEVAQTFAAMHPAPRRSIVFLWPSAEEVGLHGSGFYSKNPLFPLSKTVACINLDMVGRVYEPRDSVWKDFPKKVKDFDGIYALVNQYNPSLKKINDEACSELGLVPDYNLPSRFFNTSDHYHFHRNKVPVLNLSTGYSADYHKTTDEAWRLRPDKMKRVAQLCILNGIKLANDD
jgi:Zn-dependent M28 family amino/carboxypeptidase